MWENSCRNNFSTNDEYFDILRKFSIIQVKFWTLLQIISLEVHFTYFRTINLDATIGSTNCIVTFHLNAFSKIMLKDCNEKVQSLIMQWLMWFHHRKAKVLNYNSGRGVN